MAFVIFRLSKRSEVFGYLLFAAVYLSPPSPAAAVATTQPPANAQQQRHNLHLGPRPIGHCRVQSRASTPSIIEMGPVAAALNEQLHALCVALAGCVHQGRAMTRRGLRMDRGPAVEQQSEGGRARPLAEARRTAVITLLPHSFRVGPQLQQPLHHRVTPHPSCYGERCLPFHAREVDVDIIPLDQRVQPPPVLLDRPLQSVPDPAPPPDGWARSAALAHQLLLLGHAADRSNRDLYQGDDRSVSGYVLWGVASMQGMEAQADNSSSGGILPRNDRCVFVPLASWPASRTVGSVVGLGGSRSYVRRLLHVLGYASQCPCALSRRAWPV